MKHKKIVISCLVILAVTAGVIFYSGNSDKPEMPQVPSQTMDVLKTELTENTAISTEKHIEKKSETVVTELSPCEQFELLTPEMNPRWEEFVEEHYMSLDDMSPQGGAYTTLDIASLKSLANADDTHAMLIYGSSQFWQGVNGIDIYELGYEVQNKSKESVQSHKIDYQKVQQAEEYLFKAAVLGRSGALMELYSLQNLLFSRYKNDKSKHDELREHLSKEFALLELFKQVHVKDKVLMGGFEQDEIVKTNKEKIARWLGTDNSEVIEKEYQEIQANAEKLRLEIKNKWIEQRSYYGIEPFPKLLDDKLESYLSLQNQCNNSR